MNETFDDVLILPKFSEIASRKDVDVRVPLGEDEPIFPVISSNMDTITESTMANAMADFGARGCLHRFWDIEKNVEDFKKCHPGTWVSVGLGQKELDRADALYSAGARTLLIDVAHGASMEVVKQLHEIRTAYGSNVSIIVGNFATYNSLKDFLYHSGHQADAYKIGIGGGSACTTRLVTGVGVPTLGSILDCRQANVPLIADGGIRSSGDIAKALAAGASAVMLGGMLAGTEETPGLFYGHGQLLSAFSAKDVQSYGSPAFKKYRGSASQESYAVQNKVADWRSAEGESFLVPYKGPVKPILQQIDGGLRSAFSYVDALDIQDYWNNAEFITITGNGVRENGAHGKK